jgi:hypothetical protein
MINILRIHKLNTPEFIFFYAKCNNSTTLTYYLSLCLNHGDLKSMLQKVISKLLSYKTTYLSTFVDKIIIEIGHELTSR